MANDSAAKQLTMEVRRFGLDAAQEVARRFTKLAGEAAHFRGDDWLESSLTNWEDMVRSVAGHGPSSVPAGSGVGSQSADRLVTPASTPGATTRVKLWLHNTARQPLRVDSVRVSELQSRAGDQLTDCWDLDRPPPFTLASGASMAIAITVRIPPSTPPGLFTGLIFVAPNGIDPIPLVVEVRTESPVRP